MKTWLGAVIWPLLLVALVGMWSYGQIQQLRSLIQQSGTTHQQQLAELNDRLVALGRQQSSVSAPQANVAVQLEYQLDQQMLSTRLALVQQAINQKQFGFADQLLALQQQQLAADGGAHLPDTLRQLVIPMLGRDRQHLQNWMAQKNSHDLMLDTRLYQLQKQLDRLALQSPRLHVPGDQGGIWDRLGGMIRVEPVQPHTAQRMSLRALACRELAVTLGLARQVLATDPERFSVLLGQADAQLAALPEPELQAIRTQLKGLGQMPTPLWTGLESARLLQGTPP